ncbi:hypothetical protein [Algoriphagus limi]|uniref:Vitellogenin II n=1 Tax=Algoriphagus limi TaxID=2975273 RepID=A0ABT2G4R0_9BACT|nr:hypothetical protein [Algoriphagus limi]MCS5489758.1 hypothetical protein [Algoriphagus limi]
MKKIQIIISSVLIGSVALTSCSTTQVASTNNTDNMYFMASDARIASTYAVPNNNPETFDQIESLQDIPDESFSSRNVNPEYLARYSAENTETGDEVVYFDEYAENNSGQGDIDAYNNFRVNNNASFNSGFNTGLSFSMGFMMGTGFNPWIPRFYDPFWGFGWGPSWGFRPGISVNIGFGWGLGGFYNPFWGPRYGWGGFYDPFWGPSYAWGYPGWGMPIYPGRPIYVLPGGEYGDRRLVRGARPTRGATLAGVSSTGSRASAVLPSTSRAQARRDAVNNRSLVSSDRSRIPARDFSSSQSDYYNSGRSRIANSTATRNTSSAVLDRSSSTRNRSAMPSARPSSRTMDNGMYSPSRNTNRYNTRTASPSYNRSSPSYNRSSSPSRSGYGGTNSRTYTPSRSSSPSQMSVPSRSSSGGGGSMRSSGGGGVSRSSGSSSGSRGGRGN